VTAITRSAWGGRLPGEFGGALAVALAFDRDDLGVVDETVDEGDRTAGVGKMVGQSEKARLVVSTRLFRSHLRLTTWKSRSAARAS
jgi:hypothetical protein